MINEERITLAPEPDAAALYCQHMTKIGKVAEYCEKVSTTTSHRYVVVDIGGGTVDITAQKLLINSNNDKTIEVIHAPVGNDGGGTSVNRELIKLVQGIVGEEGDPFRLDTAFPSFFQSKKVPKSQKAELVATFYRDFEDKMEIFGDRAELSELQNDSDLSFEMPHKFLKHYQAQIDRFVAENTDERIGIEDGTIYFSYSFAKKLFQPAINKMLKCTESVLSKLEDKVDTIFLVGGFGGCNYVYQHIKEMVNTKFNHLDYRLIVPLDCKLAIVHGAILFRQSSTKFVSCVAGATYGLGVSVPFCREIHPTSHLQYDEDGYEICTGVFLTFIKEGEIAQSSEIAVEDIVPLVDSTSRVTIPIYRTYLPDLEYIWEYKDKKIVHNATKIGDIVFTIPEGYIATHKSQTQVSYHV